MELDILKLSPEERTAYEQYQNDLHYKASMLESSYGNGQIDGMEAGLKQGTIQGRKKGLTGRS